MQEAEITFVLTGPDPLLFPLWRDLEFGGHRGVNAAPGHAATDLATVQQVQDVVAAAGNMPPPVPGDTGHVLKVPTSLVPRWDTIGSADIADTSSFSRALVTAPAKPEARSLLDISLVDNTRDSDKPISTAQAAVNSGLSERLNNLEDARTAGLIILATYADLAAITTLPNNQGAQVPENDLGTHVDPVTSATVSNAGSYAFHAAAPIGWKWLGPVSSQSTATLYGSGPYAHEMTDAGNKVVLAAGTDGRVYVPGPAGLLPLPDPSPLGAGGWPNDLESIEPYNSVVTVASIYSLPDDYEDKVFLIVGLGQSLEGSANDNPDDVILTPDPIDPGYALEPAVGKKPDGQAFDAFRDVYEYPGTGYDTNKETWVSSCLGEITSQCLAHIGVKPQVAAFIASRGGRTWDQIGPGNFVHSVFRKGLANCVEAARKIRKSIEVIAIDYGQGETDRNVGIRGEVSVEHRQNMARRVFEDVRAITGQKRDPIILLHQPVNSVGTDGLMPGHILAPIELDAGRDFFLMPPIYDQETSWIEGSGNTGVHFGSPGYKGYGRKKGRAIFEAYFGKGRRISTRVISHRWYSPTRLDLYFRTFTAPLVVDLTGTIENGGVIPPAWGLAGVQCFDGTNSQKAITSLMPRPDNDVVGAPVRILSVQFAVRPDGDLRIHLGTRNDGLDAATGSNSGRRTGARTCIRDSSSPPHYANLQVVRVGMAPLGA
ncbi:hypothetical protein [Labrys wisconsinensis]|uniref:Sialate O-acetylesterase domain-containing protein n=1 Tax=Labrys wisconsinensis TaxID=425677 RepID=A0ABU0JL46_9HYPH|nr:hypothetical protein [Labrys wisconsinensis]MDQ0475015.1 hypothetical protein [Labrys wisconsinensis]